jgi:hypothetical protein
MLAEIAMVQVSILIRKLSEYKKLAEIAMVQVLSSVEGERNFNILALMKNRLQNHLTTHLDICVRMFNHNFFSLSTFPYDDAIIGWKDQKVRYQANQ